MTNEEKFRSFETFRRNIRQPEIITFDDRIVVMREGRIQQIGSPTELYEQPKNTYVASFIGSPPMNFLEGRVEGATASCCPLKGDVRNERRGPAGARPRLRAGDSGRDPVGAHRLLRQAGRGRRLQHRGHCRYCRASWPHDARAGEDGLGTPA